MTALAMQPATAIPGAHLEVDLATIAANTRVLAAATAADLMAVVKADAFGHGAGDVARVVLANGATSLGVTSLEEALDLRSQGLTCRVLSWLNPVDARYDAGVRNEIDLAVPTIEHLAAIVDAGSPARPARVHLHLDTGMARDGAEPSRWASLCCAARRAERAGLLDVVGVMGHLGCADDPHDGCNALGRRRFAWGLQIARAAGLRPRMRHLAATAATLTDPRTHHTHVRVGAGLFGIAPGSCAGLVRPALTLTAPVVSLRRVQAGCAVGYGHSWTAPRATGLALLPVGYADGVPRAVSGRAEVLLRGRRRPVVGRISMDQLVVDVGDDEVLPGEVATIFGPGAAGEPTVSEWARWAGTIEHEIVTGVGPRVRRSVSSAACAPLRLDISGGRA